MSQNLTQRDLSATSEYCKFWLRVVARCPLQARMEAPASKGRCCRWFQVFSLRPDLALGTLWLNVKSMYYDLLDLTNQTLNMEVFHPQLWLPWDRKGISPDLYLSLNAVEHVLFGWNHSFYHVLMLTRGLPYWSLVPPWFPEIAPLCDPTVRECGFTRLLNEKASWFFHKSCRLLRWSLSGRTESSKDNFRDKSYEMFQD